MEDDEDLKPKKEIHMIEQYSEIEWLTPTTDDHRVAICKRENVNWAAMKRWCEQYSEDTVVIWPALVSEVCFFFFRKSDAVAFKLRWK